MKKFAGLLMAVLMIAVGVFSSACTHRGDEGEAIDESKTQLYVYNHNGGYGTDWLYTAAKRFEKQYAETSFEKDKVGVQIIVDPQVTWQGTLFNTIEDNPNEVYFVEQVPYYDRVSAKKLLDITDIVTENLNDDYGENKTIESKLTQSQRDFFKVGGKTYYGIPHYSSYAGISYDANLFEREGFYLAANPDNGNDGFVSSATEAKSAGSDGKQGTFDDGLPATYDEFFKLCARIKGRGMTPINWTYTYRETYLRDLLASLWTDFEGAEQMSLNYSYGGEATHIVKSFDVDEETGEISNMTFEEPTAIKESNGYLLSGQAGRAYALSFLERIVRGDYMSGSSKVQSSHLEQQLEFLRSDLKGDAIAMHVDGSYWFGEAKKGEESSFNQLIAEYGNKAKPENRKIGLMPLPKATQAGETTLLDQLYSLGCIKANIAPSKIPVAKKFLQFCHTDESLREFTLISDTPKSLQYDLGDDYSKLSFYGKSLWDLKSSSTVLYPVSTNEMYLNNQSKLNMCYNWKSNLDSGVQNIVVDGLTDGNSCKQYFEGIKKYYNKTYWDANFSNYYKN